MYEAVVYFNGPRTQWSGKVVDDDLIARFSVRFLWLARLQAKSLLGQLNQGRCGYFIMLDGKAVEGFDPGVEPS